MFISLKNLEEVLIHLIKVNEKSKDIKFGIMLNGATGIGKTTIIRNLSKKFGYKLIDIRLSRELPENLGGIPFIETTEKNSKNKERFFRKVLYKRIADAFDNKCLIFFDEFNRSNVWVRNAIMSLLYERELEGNKLHPESVIFAAINTGKNYQVDAIDEALLARFAIINVKVDKFSDSLIEYYREKYKSAIYIIAKQKEIIDIISKQSEIEELTPRYSLRNLEFGLLISDYCFENNVSEGMKSVLLRTVLPSEIATVIETEYDVKTLQDIIKGKNIEVEKNNLPGVLSMLAFYKYEKYKDFENVMKWVDKTLKKYGIEDVVIGFLKNLKTYNEVFYTKYFTKNLSKLRELSKLFKKLEKGITR